MTSTPYVLPFSPDNATYSGRNPGEYGGRSQQKKTIHPLLFSLNSRDVAHQVTHSLDWALLAAERTARITHATA